MICMVNAIELVLERILNRISHTEGCQSTCQLAGHAHVAACRSNVVLVN